MVILKGVLCIIILWVMPELLGLWLAKYSQEKNNIFFALVVGYLFEFALFELLYVPLYFLKCSFKMIEYTWSAVMLILTILAIILTRKRFKEIAQATVHTLKKMPKIILLFFVLLALQVYVPVRYMQHIDLDDAFYLSCINTTIHTNTLFAINAYDGISAAGNMIRYSMSGLVVWFASISDLLKIHPAILQHTIWPAVAIPLEFMLYSLLGNQLFDKDKEKLSYFLIFLSVIYMFGFVSIFTNFAFFAYRSWQGKALIANFLIPAAWLFYFKAVQNDKKIIYWLLFLFVMISSIFITELGVFLVPVEVGVLSAVNLVQERKPLTFLKSMACLVPQVIVGVIYILFK